MTSCIFTLHHIRDNALSAVVNFNLPFSPVYPLLALLNLLAGCAPVVYQPSARQRQMDCLVQNFDRYDRNGDGYLCRGELASGLHLSPAGADRMMSIYDSNHDLLISHEEAVFAASLGPTIFADK